MGMQLMYLYMYIFRITRREEHNDTNIDHVRGNCRSVTYNGLYLRNGGVTGLCSIDFFTPHAISFKMMCHMSRSTEGAILVISLYFKYI